MSYIDLFLSEGFDFPEKDQKILNQWYEEEKENHAWGIPKLLPFDEAMGYKDYCSQMFDGFPGGKAVILWEAEGMSAIGGYYYTGETAATADTTITFGVKADSNQAPGVYSNQVVITASVK